jgi:hypothetical protein
MLNWALLKNPLNWFIVVLMLIIGGFVIDVCVQHLRNTQPQASDVK